MNKLVKVLRPFSAYSPGDVAGFDADHAEGLIKRGLAEAYQTAEQVLAGEQAEADRLAAEKAEADRLAAEKAEADRLAAEKAAGKAVAKKSNSDESK